MRYDTMASCQRLANVMKRVALFLYDILLSVLLQFFLGLK